MVTKKLLQEDAPQVLPAAVPGRTVLLPRYSQWEGKPSPSGEQPPCHGETRRAICVFSAFDLARLSLLEDHLFLNKFDVEVDALAVQCWTERVATRGD